MPTAPDARLLSNRHPSASAGGCGVGHALRRFRRDRKGAAAVEFAMVLPILLMFYLCTYEGARGFDALQKTSAVAETTGNLVTRLSSVSTTQLTNILTLSGAIMSPFTDDLKIVVTAVKVDDKGVATVAWSRQGDRNGHDNTITMKEDQPAGSSFTLPAELAGQKSTFFIETKATFSFKVLAAYGNVFIDHNMVRTNVFRPRVGDEVKWAL